jgi:hypothetical protein
VARIFISHSNLDGETAQRMKDWLDNIGFDKAYLDIEDQTGLPPRQSTYQRFEGSLGIGIVKRASQKAVQTTSFN